MIPLQNYVEVSQGSHVIESTCWSGAGGPVTTFEECQIAAQDLYGNQGQPVQIDNSAPASSDTRPPYCYCTSSGTWFNGAGNNTGFCRPTSICLCVAHSPPPPSLPPPPQVPIESPIGGADQQPSPPQPPLPPPPSPPPQTYVLLQWGRCDTNAGGFVTTLAECESAASLLQLWDTVATDASSTSVTLTQLGALSPRFCYLSPIQALGLVFDGSQNGPGLCSIAIKCLCRAHAPLPSLPPLPPLMPPLPLSHRHRLFRRHCHLCHLRCLSRHRLHRRPLCMCLGARARSMVVAT